MSSSPSPTGAPRPTPAQLAELVHHGIAVQLAPGDAVLASVRVDDATGELDLGLWPIPDGAAHPADPLVGFVAPPDWSALGLVCTGRLRHLDRPGAAPQRVVTTALACRDQPGASVLQVDDAPLQLIEGDATGWVADVLARALGRPTPPATTSPAILIELAWIDQLATGLLARPSRMRSWRWMADRHPLRGGGPVPSPTDLSARTAIEGAARTWRSLREAVADAPLPAARMGPPGGRPTTAAEWFDDGALSRWLCRDFPPPEQLVPDLLAVLPEHLGEALADALVEVEVDLGEAA
jgi:hypothetical protein